MIGVIFEFGNQTVEVRIIEDKVLFRTSEFQNFGSIDNICLSKTGVVTEFPDLKGNDDWERIARERFKIKMKEYKSEMDRADYIIQDLKKL